MLVIRSYAVLHHLVVEVTCWHGQQPQESHLVYREQVEGWRDPVEALAAVADVLERAATAAHHGDVEMTDDCGL